MSFLPTVRQLRTASTRLRRPYEAMVPDSSDERDTNVTDVWATYGCKVFLVGEA